MEFSGHRLQHGFEQVKPVNCRYCLPKQPHKHGRGFRLIGQDRFKIDCVPTLDCYDSILDLETVLVYVLLNAHCILCVHSSQLYRHSPFTHHTWVIAEHIEIISAVDSCAAD